LFTYNEAQAGSLNEGFRSSPISVPGQERAKLVWQNKYQLRLKAYCPQRVSPLQILHHPKADEIAPVMRRITYAD
jgi:hypothetical protein